MSGLESIFTGDGVRIASVALTLLAGGASLASAPIALAQSDQPAIPNCALIAPDIDAEPWVRTELFFGTAKPDGTTVTDAEWEAFLDEVVTPRFPDGFTVLSGEGQWQGEDDQIVEERSKIVILLYPRAAIDESNAEIEEIRTAYERRFQQESVLRADDDRPVCTSF
jgi:hypothetical protein